MINRLSVELSITSYLIIFEENARRCAENDVNGNQTINLPLFL